jgi:predicted Fe-Mo cluster-binding NifX family protein
MRIVIATDTNAGLNSPVSPHFGHAGFFVVADAEDGTVRSVRTIANPFCGSHGCGQVAGFVADQGGEVILVGGMGQRAVQAFLDRGIEAVTGAAGSASDALRLYLDGQLRGVSPCLEEGRGGGGCHD